MNQQKTIQIFEDKKVRTLWNNELEKWYFSIVDVIEILTDTDRPRKYWSDLKAKLKKEGSELSEKIGQLKMAAEDGKMRLTDVAATFNQHKIIAQKGGNVAKAARVQLENTTGKKVVTKQNAKSLGLNITKKIKGK